MCFKTASHVLFCHARSNVSSFSFALDVRIIAVDGLVRIKSIKNTIKAVEKIKDILTSLCKYSPCDYSKFWVDIPLFLTIILYQKENGKICCVHLNSCLIFIFYISVIVV